jgi:hypothetical protein
VSVLSRLSPATGDQVGQPPRRRRADRRKALVGLLVLMLVAGGVATALAVRDIGSEAAARPVPQTLPTKPAIRGTLTATVQVTGRLGYAGTYSLVGRRGGTATEVPAVGQVIRRGQSVYDVDQRPVPLMYGAVPFYRTLDVDSEGDDVKTLEQNLVALGHADSDVIDVDREYTAGTAAAVRRWQDHLNVAETGTVSSGDALVAPGEIRVTSVSVLAGQNLTPGQVVVAATGTSRNVRVDLALENQQYARAGERVTVDLPNGRDTTGRITRVGTVASAPQGGSDSGTAGLAAGTAGGSQQDPQSDWGAGEGANGRLAIPVDIALQDGIRDLGGLDQAPVTVNLVSSRRVDVLSVPVEALLARPEGGYGVMVVADGGARRLVPVRTGLFASGRVEVSGEGIAAGIRVEVPTL